MSQPKTSIPMAARRNRFADARFMTAAQKRRVLDQWAKFLDSGFESSRFTGGLYAHLAGHCAFIAHFDRGGFFSVYFADPSATQRFLDQFDRAKGCRSAEYGDDGWVRDSEYADLNAAMVDKATSRLPALRHLARQREVAMARRDLERAELRLTGLLADGGGNVIQTKGRREREQGEG